MKTPLWLIVIGGITLSSILYPIVSIESESFPNTVTITNSRVFNPLCIGQQNFDVDFSSFCKPHSQWSTSLGASGNIDDPMDNNSGHVITQFFLIPLDNISKNDILKEVSVDSAYLELRTTFDNRNTDEVDTEFLIVNSFCKNIDWDMNSNMADLPCIENKYIDWADTGVSEYQKISELASVSIDITSHVISSLENEEYAFTELIQFHPKQFKITAFTSEQRSCLYLDVKYLYDIIDCINENRISVYGIGHPANGLKPKITINYSIQPSLIGKIITTLVGIVPALFSVGLAIYLDKKSQKHSEKISKEISKQGEIINESKEILQKQLEHYDERYQRGFRLFAIYTSTIQEKLYDLILQGECDVKITQHMENQLYVIGKESDDLEFSASKIYRGVVPRNLTNVALEISKLGKEIVVDSKNSNTLNLEKSKELLEQTKPFLEILMEKINQFDTM